MTVRSLRKISSIKFSQKQWPPVILILTRGRKSVMPARPIRAVTYGQRRGSLIHGRRKQMVENRRQKSIDETDKIHEKERYHQSNEWDNGEIADTSEKD